MLDPHSEVADLTAVLVVQGEAPKRALLTGLLARHGIESAVVPTGEAALAAIQTDPPSLVIIDVELQDVAAYELCRQLREVHQEAFSIIFLSAGRTSKLDRIAGLLIGADDYVGEPYDQDELIARVRRCLERSAALRPTPTAQGAASRDGGSNTRELTEREHEVLRMLAQGMTQSAIAEALVVSPKTVATHVQHTLSKLGVHSRAQAVALAYREGLV